MSAAFFVLTAAAIITIEVFHGSTGGVATAFLVSPPPSSGKSCYRQESLHASVKTNEEEAPSNTKYSSSRRNFASSIVAGTTFATAAAIIDPIFCPPSASADEPNNLYYKSKADEEDPLAAFGKSLQNTNNADSSSSVPNSSGTDASSFSFSDIALPSDDDASSPPSQMGGDLGKALQEMKEAQKGRVDPRTHG